jgi:DNA-binding CsgD family transcriptional regulator
MLIENERIYPKEKDILTPELRIYALIRLGINDSARIAELLHYSPQTVYNYKIKIKNKLAISKEEFIEKILVIGR